MPHMMPMLWTLIFLLSFLSLFLLSTMIYFLYIPPLHSSLSPKKSNYLSTHQWKWTW